MGSNMDTKKRQKITNREEDIELFIIFEIEFVNKMTGQVVNLATTCGSYKELGKYLTDMEKKSWRMLKTTRRKN